MRCGSCGASASRQTDWRCPACGSPLEIELPTPDAQTFVADPAAQGVWRYRGWLPQVEPVTLDEPRTALVELRDSGRTAFAKLEGGLVTGSFKDRGASVTVSWLRAHGVQELIVDSSGNAGASFAAYAARAGLRARVFAPVGTSPAKLVQVRAHGATVVLVEGPRSKAGEAAQLAFDGAGPDVAYASHLWQPTFLAGTATFAYEVFEQLGRQAPDAIVVPLGGGTLLLGIHLGFARLRAARMVERVPRLIGVQSTACAPLARALRTGAPDAAAIEPGPTIAEGIRIARPPRSRQILAAVSETGGEIVEATDDEIRTSLRALWSQGIFVEPTSAAAHAGLERTTSPGETVVIALTGHGLKATDPITEILDG